MTTRTQPVRQPTSRRLPAALAVLAFVLSVVGGWAITVLQQERYEAVVDARVAHGAATVQALLGAELGTSLQLLPGLRALVAYDPALSGLAAGDGPVADALAEVFVDGRHLRNVGIAPGNVISHVHPYEGNEAAIGLRYEDVPAQWADVERAMRTGETVLAGPVELVQGGRGVIARTPVTLADGRYWGVISLVIDVDSLVEAVVDGTADSPIEWAARSVGAAGSSDVPVAGDQALFERDDAVAGVVDVPGGRWEIASVPSAAALAGAPPVGPLRLLVVVAGCVVGALVWLVARQREQLLASSLHDPLTGLPNRRLLDERLEHAVRGIARGGDGCGLVVLDLDGFKEVNDDFGHAVGDRALQDAAARLAAAVRPGDTVARLGGDEFVVVLAETSLAAAVEQVAPRLLAALTFDVRHGGGSRSLGATLGLAHAPSHATTAASLFRLADGALYAGKRRGGGIVVVVDESASATPVPPVPADRGTAPTRAVRGVDPVRRDEARPPSATGSAPTEPPA